jgi:hypothetical protein
MQKLSQTASQLLANLATKLLCSSLHLQGHDNLVKNTRGLWHSSYA